MSNEPTHHGEPPAPRAGPPGADGARGAPPDADATVRVPPPESPASRRPSAQAGPVTPSGSDAIGTQIGPYKILDLLGEGGFGAVYAAEQREPVRRRVALKVVKLGMDSKEVIARFEAERQALALMDHPNVAKVFDAGITDRGRPYFAMEMVPGVPISQYCDEANLSTRQRLDLFVHVCHAVQHAHLKGIIHRDLKPGNILVMLVDGKPVPKVIDFGIAKATNHQLSAQTIYTETGRLMGTPEYMAPEQAGTSGLDVDSRADVYSLGVILYELLTGALPIEASKIRAGGYEGIAKVLREMEPAKPSTRLTESRAKIKTPTVAGQIDKATVADIAKHRHTDPSSLRHQLRGDLDWITLKALEKDRTRRYETASALAMDIERHLSNEPILARPPSAGYKLSKFVRKHKVGVAAAGFVALALVGGVIGTTLGMVRAVNAERIAQANEAKAKSVSKFLTDMLSAADVNELGLKTTLGTVLESAVRSLDSAASPEHPEVNAAVRMAVGNTYLSMREGRMAKPLIAEALKLRQQVSRGPSAELAESLNDMALTLTLIGLREPQGESPEKLWEEADKLYGEALAMKKQVHGEKSKQYADALNNIAGLRQQQKKFQEAADLNRQALEIRRAVLGKDHKDVAQSLHNLAFVLKELGTGRQDEKTLDEAESTYREAVEMRTRILGPDSPVTGTSLNNLATLLRERKKPDKAEPYQRQALAIRKAKLPPGHMDTLMAQASLGLILTDLDRGAEAEPLLKECLEAFGKQATPSPTLLASTRSALGGAILAQGRYEEAEPLVVNSYEELRDNPRVPWDRKRVMIERIVKLYEKWGKADKVAAWKPKLDIPG